MHAFVTSKNVKWCHLIWPTLYVHRSVFNRAKNCVRVLVMSSFPAADCSMLMDQRLESFVDRSQQISSGTLLDQVTFTWRRVETTETGMIN